MRVHIVCDRLAADRILPRKARYLVKNGWTLSEKPVAGVEINYFMNYIPWRQHFNNWHKTKIAAYFTHRDSINVGKALWWDESAKAMDLCMTSSKLNLEHLPGERTLFARPPVEVDRFTIQPTPKQARPIVGVAGFTYGDNRKGEHLIAELARHNISRKLELKASGRGWPVPTKWYSWQELPNFFQSLDVLVVPSLYEGVPMPPLEALACGVKIVIPRNVGILDDLPDKAGIYRYRCGNAGDMIRQVENAAFGESVDRKALRDVITSNYTEKHWLEDHVSAFSAFFHCVPVEEKLSPLKGNCGVYIVAFGDPARECAKLCMKAVHKYMPDIPIALVSTKPLGSENIFIEQKDTDIGGRLAKIRVDELAPQEWKYILYLDADTEIKEDVSTIFKILQSGFEFIICKDMSKYATVDMMIRPDNKDECKVTWDVVGTERDAFQYNGGMMAYRRNPRTIRFFQLWQEEWQKWAKRDQAALLRALYRQPLRMYLLMNQWNATDRYEFPPGKIAIVHHNTRARRWAGIINERTDSKVAWQAVRMWEKQHGDPCSNK